MDFTCVDITTILQYLLIGLVYTVLKSIALWEYYGDRSLYVKLHHHWFEMSFWPLDMFRSGAKLLFS